uniref:Uncharacterized protein n=1 Tax=Arundo donax TaxID=35708 RepID=A0A0A8ZLX6_ARUDO
MKCKLHQNSIFTATKRWF